MNALTVAQKLRLAPVAGSEADWWRGAVTYQIYPRSFLDSSGDGLGDLRGIARKLDYIASLGVDAIWICPFFPSPMRDFGYDVADYCNVDPRFGTLDDFDEIVRRAHELGLKVMIDQVWSHTSDEHPWFAESRRERGGPRDDWYVWADPKPDGSPPNNWLSVFGGPAWHWEPRRRQYYLHHFLASQPQLNLRNPQVVNALFAAGRFWLDRGVDGFRLDAVDFMFHDPLLRDNPPKFRIDGPQPTRPFGMQQHVYDMLHPDLLDFFAQVRGLMASYPGSATLAEVSSEPGALGRCALYTESGSGRLDMAYTLELMKRELTAASLRTAIADAGDNGCICWAFSNHDVVRATTRWGNGDPVSFGRMLLPLLLSLPGAACLYQGEELGLTEAEIAPKDMVDPYGIAFYPTFKGRDGARTPMPWQSDVAGAGFTEAPRPWLPIGEAHRALAVDRQDRDPESLLNFARRFIAWRGAQPALRIGSARVLTLPEPIFAIERHCREQGIIAVFNLGKAPVKLPRADLPAFVPFDHINMSVQVEGDDLHLGAHGFLFGALTA
jgi:alpha-glucosidase